MIERTLVVALLMAALGAASCRPAAAADTAAALVAAAKAGDAAAVKSLLDAGADVNKRSGGRRSPPFLFRHGETALCAAAEAGHADVVELLLSRGADKARVCAARFIFWGLGDSEARGYTPLLIAAQKDNADVVKALLKETPENALADINGQRAAMCDPAPCVDSVGVLFPTFYFLVGGWRHRNDALETAELYRRPEIVRLLAEAAGPAAAFRASESLGPGGSIVTSPSPLLWASAQGDPELVRWLLQHGADPELTDGTGRIALQVALDNGNAGAAVVIRGYMRRDIRKAEAAAPEPQAPSPEDLEGLVFNGDPYQSSDALNDAVSLSQSGDTNGALQRVLQAVNVTGLTPGLAKEAAKDGAAANTPVPDELRTAEAAAENLFQSAQDEAGYEAAIDSTGRVVRAAPWWGQAWRDLSAMYDAADDEAEAVDCLEIYLYSAPSPADAAAARARIEALKSKLIEEQGITGE